MQQGVLVTMVAQKSTTVNGNLTKEHMKITYTKEEVTKIILAHANATTYEGITFNTVVAGSYSCFPKEFEVTFEVPESTNEVNA